MSCLVRAGLIAAATLLTVARALPAQAPDTLSVPAGARVRVSTQDQSLRHQAATLLSADSGALVLTYWNGTAADTVQFAPAAIVSLEISRGRRSRLGAGALAGGLLGAALGVATYQPCDRGSVFCFDFGIETNLLAGAGLGMIAGGLVGLFIRSDRWVAVPGSTRIVPSLAITPANGAVRLGVTASLPALRR